MDNDTYGKQGINVKLGCSSEEDRLSDPLEGYVVSVFG